jgi:serine/threonine-protein kinase
MTDLSRWPQADDLLDRALELPPDERVPFVRAASGDDAGLATALELILLEADRADGFLAPGGALTGPLAADLARVTDASTADANRLAVGARFGDYDVLDVLGRGGMGEVYRARDVRLGREVALKVLPTRFAADTERHDRFVREARLLAALNHPRIAAIYDIDERDGVMALVLELVPGETLADRLTRGPLPVGEAIVVARQIVEALEAAHQRGVVHRDLKPANIKLTPDDGVKVLDFGIAKAVVDDSGDIGGAARVAPDDTATRPEVLLGTAAYVSPERARRQRSDHRADIWAFGCVLYEMLTGERAFDGATSTEVLARVLEREPDMTRLPADVPPPLRRLLDRTLRKDPARRLGYIGDALLDLEDAEPGRGPTAAPAPARAPRPIALPIALALAAGLVGGGALTWWAQRADPPPAQYLRVPVPDSDELVAGQQPGLALTPDGSTVIYRARRDGVLQLVKRTLSSDEAAVIPGTVDAASPFFSPDGAWLGYVGPSQLFKVPIAGGTPVPLCDAPGGARASWADDDTVLFSTGTGLVIFRVPASGGTAVEVTKLDTNAGHRAHEAPFALPGSRTALVTIVRDGGPQVGVADLATGDVRAIADGRQPQLIGRRVVFLRGDALWAAGFDPARGALTTEPAVVLEGLEQGSLNGTGQFAVSAAGALVYMPRRRNADLRVPVWVTRDGAETPLPIEPAAYTRATVSPDGRRIALALATPEQRDIWIYDIARGTLMRLTLDPSTDTAPVWSPDSLRVAYRSERSGGGIFLQPADGAGTAERLTRSDVPGRPAHTPYAFTPDGGTLLFAELRSYSDQGIAAVTVASPPVVSVVLDGPYAEARPALSPDGQWLAYQSDESGRFEIYVRPYPGVTAARVPVSTTGGASPRWAANGRELFYFDGRSMVAVRAGPGRTPSLGRPAPLFDASKFSERLGPVYDVAADGRFLFLRQGGVDRRDDLRIVQHFR